MGTSLFSAGCGESSIYHQNSTKQNRCSVNILNYQTLSYYVELVLDKYLVLNTLNKISLSWQSVSKAQSLN
uniref:Putative ovule protein n=1 Tax=Solanum chacoense TaxID=4108 RepID=A0A0V0GWP7_SOLCH